MKRIFGFLEQKLAPMGEKIGKQRHLKALREGIMMAMPLVLLGSFFVLIKDFPIAAWTEWLKSHWGLDVLLNTMANNSFGLMALITAFGIAYRLAESYDTDGPSAGVLSLGAFLLTTPSIVAEDGAAGIPYGMLGGKGIFAAIVVAMISAEIYRWFIQKNITIKMPAGVPPTVVQSFAALIPATVVMTFFFAINLLFGFLGTNVFQIIFEFLQTPLLNLGDTLGAMIIAYIFLHLFWFFGVNGGSVVGAVFNPILQTLSVENIEFFKTGVGEGHIICQQFQDLFATFGGCGSTLSLIIAMLLFCKSKRITELGKLSLVPGIFGINEPIVFGLPIVLNPTMIIPFILVPTINIIISYLAMSAGLVPICSGINIPWTTPVIISGFLATNWVGAILQAVLLVLGIFIYMPFIKIMDKQYINDEANAVHEAEEDDFSLDDLSFDDL